MGVNYEVTEAPCPASSLPGAGPRLLPSGSRSHVTGRGPRPGSQGLFSVTLLLGWWVCHGLERSCSVSSVPSMGHSQAGAREAGPGLLLGPDTPGRQLGGPVRDGGQESGPSRAVLFCCCCCKLSNEHRH